jgi:hypothetical protein
MAPRSTSRCTRICSNPSRTHYCRRSEELGIFSNHDFPTKLLWERPANVASVGFHLQHLAGVLDRLFTYASRGIAN